MGADHLQAGARFPSLATEYFRAPALSSLPSRFISFFSDHPLTISTHGRLDAAHQPLAVWRVDSLIKHDRDSAARNHGVRGSRSPDESANCTGS